MKLDALNQWLTLLANFGVVAGLIFLAVELSQNTTAVQANAIQEATSVARQQVLTLATDPELNRLTMASYDELDEEQQSRVFWLSRSFWLGMQGLFRQWELGVLPDDEWSVWQRVICFNYAAAGGASGGQPLWEKNKAGLVPRFVTMVETSCVQKPGRASD